MAHLSHLSHHRAITEFSGFPYVTAMAQPHQNQSTAEELKEATREAHAALKDLRKATDDARKATRLVTEATARILHEDLESVVRSAAEGEIHELHRSLVQVNQIVAERLESQITARIDVYSAMLDSLGDAMNAAVAAGLTDRFRAIEVAKMVDGLKYPAATTIPLRSDLGDMLTKDMIRPATISGGPWPEKDDPEQTAEQTAERTAQSAGERRTDSPTDQDTE